MSTDFLIQQIEEYQETWEQDPEAWKQLHDEAIEECWKLVDQIRAGLGWFRIIREADEAWSRKVQTGTRPFSAENARHIRDYYEQWILPCNWVLPALVGAEKKFGAMEGAQELRDAEKWVRSILALPFDKLAESMTQLANKSCHPLDKVLDELAAANHRSSKRSTGRA